MANFPGSIKTFTTLVDLADSVLASHHNDRGDEITAIETYLLSLLGEDQTMSEGQMWNGQIVPSVSSNNLTLALKTLDGGDPSSTDPVRVRIGATVREVTSSLSVTVNAGTNTFNAGAAEFATLAVPFYAYLCYKSSDQSMVLLFSRIPYARTHVEFSGTATDEKYAAYSAAPAGTDDVVNIGYFEAINSGSASYNWSVSAFTTKNLKSMPTYRSNVMTWSPQWTNLTVGNATVVAKYVVDGRFVIRDLTLTWGNTTSITGTGISYTVPFSNPYTVNIANNTARFLDNSGPISYAAVCYITAASNSVSLLVQSISATYLRANAVTSTIPMTWTTDDAISDSGTYRIAD